MNREITITNIGKARVAGFLGFGLFLVVALAPQAYSQTILIDDFDDGNADGWSIIDTTIGEPWGPGTFDASSGAYHFEGGGLAQAGGDSGLAIVWDESSDPTFRDGFVRAKVRSETLGGTAGILLRYSPDNLYAFFGTTANNGIPGNGAFLYNKGVNGRQAEWRQLPGNFRFGVNEDWYIEAGAVGNQLSMKVWRVGEPEPESPQLTLTDSAHGTGQFGVYSNIHASPFPGPARVSATFDDIYFRFPEHDDFFTISPYNIHLWESPMPVPQQEGPYFVASSPEKPDMRGDVTTADGWPDLHLTGKVTDFDGKSIPGLRLDFWQTDDNGNYDNSGGYDLRGHIYTNEEGNYELWTVMPAAYETVRTRHLHLKIGGVNLGFQSPVFTTQLYFPTPYDNDIDADSTPDKVVQGGFETDFDGIPLEEDYITLGDLTTIGAEFSDLAGNILSINNDPAIDGYFDATLNIRMSDVFQAPERTPNRILIDNFNDGNYDGWIGYNLEGPIGPSIFDASSGAYRLASTGEFWNVGDIRNWDEFRFTTVLDTIWDPVLRTGIGDLPFYSNGLFRFRFRIDGNATHLRLHMRANQVRPNAWSFYTFGATSLAGSQDPENDPVFVFRKQVAGVGRDELLEFGNPRLHEEWMLEAGAIGNQLTMKWWPVGGPEPDEPQFEWTDPDPLPPGHFYMEVFVDRPRIVATGTPPPWLIDATFDDIYFTLPEHDNVYAISPYDVYLWESPMPVPQVEESYFVAGSPNKTDMRGDVTKAEGWPELHLTGKVTELHSVGRSGQPIPGLRLDFWQTDDKGNYDNSSGYALRGHVYTDSEGNYELWTIMPAGGEVISTPGGGRSGGTNIRTRHLHLNIGGDNLGFRSPVYTTQIYFPDPYDNDIDADGTPDKVAQDGVETDFDVIGLEEDYIALVSLIAVDAESSDLASNTMTLNNDPAVDGYFDATLNIVMPQAFKTPDD
jgi:protocatechuate 3,4-dioxygenase beta subunit